MAAIGHYAVLQRNVGRPAAEGIRRAFRAFSTLTDADAIRLAANAQGILMRQLPVDAAKALHQALTQEGVPATLVPESELRLLPEITSLHRLEMSAAGLVVFDLHGRAKPVAWAQITLVAAGAIWHAQITHTQNERSARPSLTKAGNWPNRIIAAARKPETHAHLILELLVADHRARYEINADQFPFKYTQDHPGWTPTENFIWLASEIVRQTPTALLNRGAADVRDGIRLPRGYPDRQGFNDELIWLLWREAQQARHAAGGAGT